MLFEWDWVLSFIKLKFLAVSVFDTDNLFFLHSKVCLFLVTEIEGEEVQEKKVDTGKVD